MKSLFRRVAPVWIAVALGGVIIPLRAAEPATFKVTDYTFKRPAGWQWVETHSSMRAAQLKIADAKAGGEAEVVFYYFGPGGAGGVQANISRWLSQFGEPRNKEITEATVGHTKVTYVTAEGTYQSGMPGGPKTPMPGYALCGAIVEGGQGSIFVKMTGPKQLVEARRMEFKQMIEDGLK